MRKKLINKLKSYQKMGYTLAINLTSATDIELIEEKDRIECFFPILISRYDTLPQQPGRNYIYFN